MFTHIDTSSLKKYVGKKIGRRSHTNSFVKLGVAVGVAASLGFFARELYRLAQARRKTKESEAHVDATHEKALKGSFPASDPPASQYFDIPVNRQ
jgi:hypothetical protein